MRFGLSVIVGLSAGGYLVVRRRRQQAARAHQTEPHPHTPMPEAIEASNDPTDVFTILRAEHGELKTMAARLQDRSDPSRQLGRQAIQQLVIHATQHEAIEETEFWPVIRSELADGDELADKAIEDEIELRRLLHRLDRFHPADVGYDHLIETFATTSYDHLIFEETKVWPQLSRAIDLDARAALGADILRATKKAPTRPHVSAPATPGKHRKLGKTIAMLDRLEDRITHRGQ